MTSKPLKTVDNILTWFIGYPKEDTLNLELWEDTVAQLNSHYKELFLSIIGEDEKFRNVYQWQQAEPLNLLKQELREKLSEHFNGEGE